MKTITSMVKQLRKKFPDKEISISKSYDNYLCNTSTEIHYSVYVSSDVICKNFLTYNQLTEEVGKLLKDNCK